MTAPLVLVAPERRLTNTEESLDDACAEFAERGWRWIGCDEVRTSQMYSDSWAAFVPCTATKGRDRRYYVEGRPFTIDDLAWTGRDTAAVSWSWDDSDNGQITVVSCEIVDYDVPGHGGPIVDVTYDAAENLDASEPPDYVFAAIGRCVRDAYPDHLHEWSY